MKITLSCKEVKAECLQGKCTCCGPDHLDWMKLENLPFKMDDISVFLFLLTKTFCILGFDFLEQKYFVFLKFQNLKIHWITQSVIS